MVGEWVGGGGAEADDAEEGGRGDLSSVKKKKKKRFVDESEANKGKGNKKLCQTHIKKNMKRRT
jgi:hypothetical protein